MNEIKAPEPHVITGPTIFLAGSIEMGTAELWQDRVVKALKDYKCTIFNPRRDDWDWTWEQNITNPKFYEQVRWELDSLNRADIVLFCFDPNTKSPITLLEFGMMSGLSGDKVVGVFCPDGFWRKGNVDIVAEYYGVYSANSFQDLIEFAQNALEAQYL